MLKQRPERWFEYRGWFCIPDQCRNHAACLEYQKQETEYWRQVKEYEQELASHQKRVRTHLASLDASYPSEQKASKWETLSTHLLSLIVRLLPIPQHATWLLVSKRWCAVAQQAESWPVRLDLRRWAEYRHIHKGGPPSLSNLIQMTGRHTKRLALGRIAVSRTIQPEFWSHLAQCHTELEMVHLNNPVDVLFDSETRQECWRAMAQVPIRTLILDTLDEPLRGTLEHIQGLEHVRHLSFHSCTFLQDHFFAMLQAMTWLLDLSLSHVEFIADIHPAYYSEDPLQNHHVEKIASYPLRFLALRHAHRYRGFDKHGLVYLAKMKSLQRLLLYDTNISPQDLDEYPTLKAITRCEIPNPKDPALSLWSPNIQRDD